MDFTLYLQQLRRSPFYRDQIAHVEHIPARQACFGSLEQPLEPRLEQQLEAQGLSRLYTHQAEAVNAARRGHHVTVVTATASGKTLCYNLPVLDSILRDTKSRALYLFPTKALAQDQASKLNAFGLFPEVRFATYDGDTPAEERKAVRRGAHLLLTNPDMLHCGILPNHAGWNAFLTNLRYVVIDEMHVYRGVFGAHMAQVLRRLRRICSFYGAEPQFLCCSATIANPAELTTRLIGIDGAIVVDADGAPSGRRMFVFWNPPFLDREQAERRSTHGEATALFVDLVAHGVRNITFARARKSAELILRYARGVLERESPELAQRVTCYRAGYTVEERRAIERGLFQGSLIGVTATSALELGVDIGDLDATVLTGYPGTIASAWQQAGRAGRSGAEALSVLVAQSNPLDQFLMRHPDYFFGRPHERAIVDPGNRRILRQHLLCAAHERPLTERDALYFGPAVPSLLQELEAEKGLYARHERWFTAGADYPAGRVSIRSVSDAVFRIVDSERDGRQIGSVESSVAHKTVHAGAIYLHLGETYLVERLDLEGQIAWAHRVEAHYYTEPRELSHLYVTEVRQSRPLGGGRACFGDVVVTNQVTGYRRKRLYSDEVLDNVELKLPEQTFETEAFWFTVSPPAATALSAGKAELAGSIHAVEHAVIGMMPLLATCDRWDLGGVSHPCHPDTGAPTIFIYDAYPGGVGIAEATYAGLAALLNATREMIQGCPCLEGCPSCVQSPKCGNNNQPLDKAGAHLLLELLHEETR